MKLLFPIILLGVSAATFFLFIDKTFREVEGLRQDKAKYDSALSDSNTVKMKKDELESAKRDAESVKTADGKRAVDKLEVMLPDRIDNIQFILNINEMAFDKKLILKNISMGAGGKSDVASANPKDQKARARAAAGGVQTLAKTSFSFSFSTTYDNFLAFLGKIERSLMVMDITSISFKSSDSNVYDFSLSGVLYSLK